MGALDAVRPAHIADGGETLGVVHQRLHVDHGTSITHTGCSFNRLDPPNGADSKGDRSTPWNPY